MTVPGTIESGDRPSGGRRSSPYQDLIKTLTEIYDSEEQKSYIKYRWGNRAAKAHATARKNKVWYYVLRALFVLVATLVPPTAAGSALVECDHRWLGATAAVLGALVGILAAFIEIRKPGERWRLNQKLRFDLEAAGWALAESRRTQHNAPGRQQFERFVDRTEHLLSRYATDYLSQISQISSVDHESGPAEPASRRRADAHS
jgi:hypothetical protein